MDRKEVSFHLAKVASETNQFYFLVVTDPLSDVLNFIRDFTAKYPAHPVFYQGTYAQALNDAKRELKFLLIYLHSESSSPQVQSGQERITETVNFCRNTLSNPEVIEYVNRNMLLWACDVSSPEGYRVSHSINARTYPLLVIIGLRDNKLTIMGRSEGDCTPEELLNRMQRVVSDNERWLNAARHERLERSMTQTLRAQQDVAYEESLKADQEKERQRQKVREEQQQVEKEILAKQQAEERRLELKERVRTELVQQVPSEPADTDPNALDIVFKLPNGMRINRRFLKSDSLSVSLISSLSTRSILIISFHLQDIHNFLFCHPDAPDAFEITQNFPKRVLKCGNFQFDELSGYEAPADVITATRNQVNQTVSEAGLQNREILFVNDLDA